MMEALSEGASESPQATNHLNRSAGRLEDRHQIRCRQGTPTRRHIAEAEMPMSTIATTTSHPPKHLVREYLERRTKDSSPPPTPEEIRRQLGWGMLLSAADDKMGSSRS